MKPSPNLGPITRSELNLPDVGDYEIIKEATLTLAYAPDAKIRAPKRDRIFISLERLFSDCDFLVWPPLTISFAALIGGHGLNSKMVIRYRELAHNDTTVNSGVTHDYVLKREGEVLTEYGHSIVASPVVSEKRQEPWRSDAFMDEVEQGARILRINTGRQLELTTGDCGVLFDRIANLLL